MGWIPNRVGDLYCPPGKHGALQWRVDRSPSPIDEAAADGDVRCAWQVDHRPMLSLSACTVEAIRRTDVPGLTDVRAGRWAGGWRCLWVVSGRGFRGW